MIVINLFGGPGSGKTTTAHGLCYELMRQHYNVEYVSEVAKDLTWELRSKTLECQEYILGKQYRDLWRLQNYVDIAITDSPLLLSAVYGYRSSYIIDYTRYLNNQFTNINFFLAAERNHYKQVGRTQSIEEAEKIDWKIVEMLLDSSLTYATILLNDQTITKIIEQVKKHADFPSPPVV